MIKKDICKCGILAAFLFGTTVHARLGETLEQSVRRYGEPARKTEDGSSVFAKDGIVVTTHFTNDICDKIIYSKKDETPFTSDEYFLIVRNVESNDGKRHWELNGTFDKTPKYDKSSKPHAKYWISDDGFIAHFDHNGLVFRKNPDFKPKTPPLDGF